MLAASLGREQVFSISPWMPSFFPMLAAQAWVKCPVRAPRLLLFPLIWLFFKTCDRLAHHPPCSPLASSSLAGKRVMRGSESLLALSPPCNCSWYVHVSNRLLKIASDGFSTAFPGTQFWSQLSQAVSLPAATAHCFGSPEGLGSSFYPLVLH